MWFVGVDMFVDLWIRRASISWKRGNGRRWKGGQGRCNSATAGFRHQCSIQYMDCVVFYLHTVQIVWRGIKNRIHSEYQSFQF